MKRPPLKLPSLSQSTVARTASSLLLPVLLAAASPTLSAQASTAAATATPAFGDENYEAPPATTARLHDPRDPFEKFNRRIFRFNQAVDTNFLKPVAVVYRDVMPEIVSDSVNNFFTNIGQPGIAINQVLQGKYQPALRTTARFIINTSTSLGLADAAATALNLPTDDEDFGQTLGKWGIRPGPYLMLPFIGPGTVRDTGSKVVDIAIAPLSYYNVPGVRYPLATLRVTALRARLLKMEDTIQGDPYDFVKNIYLQKREYEVRDGNPDEQADSFGDEVPDTASGSMATVTVTTDAPTGEARASAATVTVNTVASPNPPAETAPEASSTAPATSDSSSVIPVSSATPQSQGAVSSQATEAHVSGYSNLTPLPTDPRSIKKYLWVLKELAL